MDLIKLYEIKQYALEQMEKWDLIAQGWSFVWDTRAVRRYGQCRYRSKEIGITKKLANINTIEADSAVCEPEISAAICADEETNVLASITACEADAAAIEVAIDAEVAANAPEISLAICAEEETNVLASTAA